MNTNGICIVHDCPETGSYFLVHIEGETIVMPKPGRYEKGSAKHLPVCHDHKVALIHGESFNKKGNNVNNHEECGDFDCEPCVEKSVARHIEEEAFWNAQSIPCDNCGHTHSGVCPNNKENNMNICGAPTKKGHPCKVPNCGIKSHIEWHVEQAEIAQEERDYEFTQSYQYEIGFDCPCLDNGACPNCNPEVFVEKADNNKENDMTKCHGCGGSGLWLSGPPMNIERKCNCCAGKGVMTPADVKRDNAYHELQAAAACRADEAVAKSLNGEVKGDAVVNTIKCGVCKGYHATIDEVKSCNRETINVVAVNPKDGTLKKAVVCGNKQAHGGKTGYHATTDQVKACYMNRYNNG